MLMLSCWCRHVDAVMLMLPCWCRCGYVITDSLSPAPPPQQRSPGAHKQVGRGEQAAEREAESADDSSRSESLISCPSNKQMMYLLIELLQLHMTHNLVLQPILSSSHNASEAKAESGNRSTKTTSPDSGHKEMSTRSSQSEALYVHG